MPSLRESFIFQRRAAGTVLRGINQQAVWSEAPADMVTLRAELTWLKGSEAVQAARLQGDQPAILTIRACAISRQITNGWRALDARDNSRVLRVTSASISENKQWVQVLAIQKRSDVDG